MPAAVHARRGGKDFVRTGEIEDFDVVEHKYAYAEHDAFLAGDMEESMTAW